MYKLTNTTAIIRTDDGASIPADISNTDYQHYVDWAKANTPTPADLPTTAQLNAPVLATLLDIDLRSIRALREGDAIRLKVLDDQAKVARGQLK